MSSKEKRRAEKLCSFCKNHGQSVILTSHNHSKCLFRNCHCDECIITRQCQRWVSENTRRSRRQIGTKEKNPLPEELIIYFKYESEFCKVIKKFIDLSGRNDDTLKYLINDFIQKGKK